MNSELNARSEISYNRKQFRSGLLGWLEIKVQHEKILAAPATPCQEPNLCCQHTPHIGTPQRSTNTKVLEELERGVQPGEGGLHGIVKILACLYAKGIHRKQQPEEGWIGNVRGLQGAREMLPYVKPHRRSKQRNIKRDRWTIAG